MNKSGKHITLPVSNETLAAMYRSGKSLPELANMFNTTRITIRARLIKLGVDLRNKQHLKYGGKPNIPICLKVSQGLLDEMHSYMERTGRNKTWLITESIIRFLESEK